MKKLIIIGDSVIKGIYTNPETGKYTLIKDNCFDTLKNDDTLPVIENKAVIGATLVKCKKILSNIDLSDGKDTAFLFSFGGNDSSYVWPDISVNPNEQYLPRTTEKDLYDGYTEMLEYVKSKGCSVSMTNLAPIDPDRYFNTITKGLNADNILTWLGSTDALYRWHEHYNNIVEDIAHRVKCKISDIRTDFLVSHNINNLLSNDGIHPSIEGHEIIHKKIGENLKVWYNL